MTNQNTLTSLYTLLLVAFSVVASAQDGALDPTFQTGTAANGQVFATQTTSDGKIVVGGDFTQFNGESYTRMVRLNGDGSIDTSFSPGTGANTAVYDVVQQPDGKLIVAGNFSNFNGRNHSVLTRLNADGSPDLNYIGTGGNASVIKVALQPDGKIIAIGGFSSFNGSTNNARIVRVNSNGTTDPSFLVGSGPGSGSVNSIALQPDGKILVGGSFSNFGGVPITRIVRLHSNGTVDTTFNPGGGPNNRPLAIAVQPDGKILIGGQFTSIDGVPRARIARLNSNGSLDTTFNPGAGAVGWTSPEVNSISLQADGRLVISGRFGTYDGVNRGNIARVNPDGSLDASFVPTGNGTNGLVLSSQFQPDGTLIVGGNFVRYGNDTVNRIMRLQTATPACNAPDSMFIGNIGVDEAELSIFHSDSVLQWEIEYDTTGFVQGTGNTVLTATSPYTFTGLNSGTTYDVYARSLCATGDTAEWSQVHMFTTLCGVPDSLTSMNETTSSVELMWNKPGSATEWQIEYGLTGYTLGSGTTQMVNTRPFLLSGLTSGTSFDYYVRSICSSGDTSDWSNVQSFVTICATPDSLSSANETESTVEVNWVEVGSAIQWEVEYDVVGFTLGAGNRMSVTTRPTILAGLGSGMSYDYYVRSICPSGDTSNWSAVSMFSTICVEPDSLFTFNETTTTIDVDWSENNGASEWDVEYGVTGFAPGAGTVVRVSNKPFTITGLTKATTYDVYISSICLSGDSSIWSDVHTFTTTDDIGVDHFGSEKDFKIFTKYNEIVVESHDNSINIVRVMDLSGKMLHHSEYLNQSSVRIDAMQLASGIYTVMVQSSNGKVVVKKIPVM